MNLEANFFINNKKNIFTYKTILHVIKKLNNYDSLKNFEENIFQVLFGLKNVCKLEIESKQLEELYTFIIYLRLISGLDLFIYYYLDEPFLINLDSIIDTSLQNDEKKQFEYKNKKTFIEKAIIQEDFDNNNLEIKKEFIQSIEKNEVSFSAVNNINILAILTCNRPQILKECILSYISNFKKFSHDNIKIIVFDDSDFFNAKKNKDIIDEIKNIYPNLQYIDKLKKNEFINGLINKSLQNFSQLNPNELKFYIYYTFGGNEFQSSYGRNRNFISFYLKNKNYISIDDDSKPIVLTCKKNILEKFIKKSIDKKIPFENAINFDEMREENKEFIDVDFLGYFNQSENITQYVKYSGDKDCETYYRLLKQMGFKIKDIEKYSLKSKMPNIISNEETLDKYKKDLDNDIFIYGEKDNHTPMIKGLCCFYPKNIHKLNVTISENLRIEDLCLGVNSFLMTNQIPIETNFALYHQKTERNITANEIHKEIISSIIYSVYINLMKELNLTANLQSLYLFHQKLKNPIFISDEAFNIYKIIKQYVYDLYQNCMKISIYNRDIDKANKLKEIINNLEKEFFSLSDFDYKQIIENLTHNTIKKYISSMILFLTLENLYFDSN